MVSIALKTACGTSKTKVQFLPAPKEKLMMMVDFDSERDWSFEPFTNRKSRANRERMKRNTNIFGDWLINLLQSTAPRPKGEDEKYDTTHVYMHPSHNLYLQQHISPWDFLDYSPVDDETVPIDKVMITNWFAKE